MRKRVAAVLGTLLMAFGIVIATASPAAAYEINYAVNATWNTDHAKDCTFDDYVFGAGDACFQPYGDYIWVLDGRTDGYEVALYWDDLDSARAGKCMDDLGADSAWTGCNKDFTEGHTIRWRFAWEWTNGWIISENYWETTA